jgi:hypothetical protein
MQRGIALPHNQSIPVTKLLGLSGYIVTAINTHPFFRTIGSGFQIVVPTLSLAVSLLMGMVLKDYDPIQQTVSQMVHYPYGWILTTDFLVVSVWLLILSAKFYFSYAQRNMTKFSALLLVLTACCFFLIALFPTNLEGTVKNPTAVVHESAARIASILFPVACVSLLPQMVRDRKHRYLAIYTTTTAIFGFLLVAVCAAIVFSGGHTLGIFERLLMTNALVWGLVVSIRLFPIHYFKIPARKTR